MLAYAAQNQRIEIFAVLVGASRANLYSTHLTEMWFRLFASCFRGKFESIKERLDDGVGGEGAVLDRGDAIEALLGGDAAARGGVERSDPKTWNCPFLAEVLPARDIAALVNAIEEMPAADKTGREKIASGTIDLDAFFWLVFARYLGAVEAHQRRLVDAFAAADEDGNGLDNPEFGVLVDACCGVGALEERAKNKLFDRMEELADDGEQDDDANISDPTAFAIVATREYEKCKLGLPAYCTRWSGSVEKFRTSLKPE